MQGRKIPSIRARPVIAPAFALGQELVDLYLDAHLLDGMVYEIEQRLDLIFISTKK